jgi:hypothetical protein
MKRCFILGTGLSLNDLDLDKLANDTTIGVNQISRKYIPDYICVSDSSCLLKNESDIINEKTKECNFVFVDNSHNVVLPARFITKNTTITSFKPGVKYFIDTNLSYISDTGGSVVQDLAIPLAINIGFDEIYLLGCDGGYRHFFDPSGDDVKWFESRYGKYRRLQKWNDVIEETDKMGVKIYTCYKDNIFKELEYRNYEELFGRSDI